jgi:hypothetical protein
MYRVINKSIYTFINGYSSVISGPIEIKPIERGAFFNSISIYCYKAKSAQKAILDV